MGIIRLGCGGYAYNDWAFVGLRDVLTLEEGLHLATLPLVVESEQAVSGDFVDFWPELLDVLTGDDNPQLKPITMNESKCVQLA